MKSNELKYDKWSLIFSANLISFSYIKGLNKKKWITIIVYFYSQIFSTSASPSYVTYPTLPPNHADIATTEQSMISYYSACFYCCFLSLLSPLHDRLFDFFETPWEFSWLATPLPWASYSLLSCVSRVFLIFHTIPLVLFLRLKSFFLYFCSS